MKCLANDTVWIKVSWIGTPIKTSFQSRLNNIHKMITEISESTFNDAISIEFINGKIKTYLRHAQERLKRKIVGDNSNNNQE